jgi:hypothetical protein
MAHAGQFDRRSTASFRSRAERIRLRCAVGRPPTATRPCVGRRPHACHPEAATYSRRPRTLSPAADGTRGRLHQALSEVLLGCGCSQEGSGLSQMTRPVRCPMTVPIAGGITCRAASVGLSQRAAPDIAKFALAPPCCPYQASRTLRSVREAGTPSTPADVSSSFSQTLETRS